MKNILFSILFTLISVSAFSQYVVVLHGADTTAAYTGNSAFQSAYDDAVDGDTLYLSGGSFSFPGLAKQLFIFGAGIHPDSTSATFPTQVINSFHFYPGSDSTRIEGVEFLGQVEKYFYHVVNDLMLTRCKFNGLVDFGDGYSGTQQNSTNYHITQCIVNGSTLDMKSVTHSIISNCIISGRYIYSCDFNDVSNNAFYDASIYIQSTNSSNFRNNVFHSTGSNIFASSCSSNFFYNNLFTNYSPDLGTGPTEIDNYEGVSLGSFYLNVPSSTFDFADDYHADPAAIPSFLGTDGEQIGIYGGLFPWKEGLVPQNPHIITKSIDHNTNQSGNLPVEFDVSAQDE